MGAQVPGRVVASKAEGPVHRVDIPTEVRGCHSPVVQARRAAIIPAQHDVPRAASLGGKVKKLWAWMNRPEISLPIETSMHTLAAVAMGLSIGIASPFFKGVSVMGVLVTLALRWMGARYEAQAKADAHRAQCAIIKAMGAHAQMLIRDLPMGFFPSEQPEVKN